MRIVGGRHGGRAIRAPKGLDTRPTADRAREAIFNVLEHGLGVSLAGIAVLDVFAGSGALGLEALSRGAGRAVFIDNSLSALTSLRANADMLGERETITVLRADATRPPPPKRGQRSAALVFLDPPYGKGLIASSLIALREKGWIAPGALCVAELAAAEEFTAPDGFGVLDRRNYGAAAIVFMKMG